MSTKTETKPTPGPWEIERVPIQSSGGSNTCWIIGPFKACIYDDGRQRERRLSEEEIEANARLIAAAPELLAFAKLFEAYCTENCQTGEISWDALQIAARAAIDKALNQTL